MYAGHTACSANSEDEAWLVDLRKPPPARSEWIKADSLQVSATVFAAFYCESAPCGSVRSGSCSSLVVWVRCLTALRGGLEPGLRMILVYNFSTLKVTCVCVDAESFKMFCACS